MSVIGVVTHHHRDQAIAHGRDLARWAEAAGHRLRLTEVDAEVLGIEGEVVADADFAAGLDLVVSLGGDGSILRAVDLIGADRVPVLGVNLGELGYLAVVEPAEVGSALEAFFDGAHGIQERMMVQASVHRAEAPVEVHHALNDVVVERGATSTTIRFAVAIDGGHFHTYAADGVIVATPTGSTAYSLSARGPVVAPGHRLLLLTPVAPHQLFDRSLVLDPDSTIEIEVDGHREAKLSVDGRTLSALHFGDVVSCTISPRSVQLVTFASQHFHRVLKSKFGLLDR